MTVARRWTRHLARLAPQQFLDRNLIYVVSYNERWSEPYQRPRSSAQRKSSRVIPNSCSETNLFTTIHITITHINLASKYLLFRSPWNNFRWCSVADPSTLRGGAFWRAERLSPRNFALGLRRRMKHIKIKRIATTPTSQKIALTPDSAEPKKFLQRTPTSSVDEVFCKNLEQFC